MKKYLLSFILIIAFALYIAFSNPSSANINPAVSTPATTNTGTGSSAKNNAGGITINEGGREGGDDGGEGGGTVTPAPAPAPAPSPAPTSSAPTPAPVPQPAATAGAFKDGSYTGPVTDAFYGPMQVQAIISGGQLSDIKILQYPNSHSYSVQVNSYALPQLAQEAIAAQSANVNVVSGATQSSFAFQQSLAAALAQAKS
jgi:uncharacterized protein with FMN-binding domain